jgi:hypothetical protein
VNFGKGDWLVDPDCPTNSVARRLDVKDTHLMPVYRDLQLPRTVLAEVARSSPRATLEGCRSVGRARPGTRTAALTLTGVVLSLSFADASYPQLCADSIETRSAACDM